MTDDAAPTFDFSPREFQALGEEVLALMGEAIAAEQRDPVVLRASGAEIRSLFDEPLPRQGVPVAEILHAWREGVLRYSRRNGHPRFFAYVCASADPLGVLADGMASALNQTVTAWRSAPAATELERLVMRWLDQLVGFGAGGTGIMVSGGSAANLHGIACAVVEAERKAGLPSGARHRLTMYVSREGHVSMRKAAQLLGLAHENVRVLDIDAERRLRPAALRLAIADDVKAGLTPGVVCASAGTANTGAIDPLDEIASICEAQDVWLHIDGSYGAPAVITEEYAWMAHGFARADSLSLDPHKWLFAPVDAGSILVRDPEAAHRAFAQFSEYTAVAQTDPIERFAFFDNGIEMSRRFRALKVWTILKARGVDALRKTIAGNIAARRHLDARVRDDPRLDGLGGDLGISCFRYVGNAGSDAAEHDRINRRIQETLVAEGRCYLSPTTLDDRFALRVCIVNFRTQQSDIDFLVDEVVRLGGQASR